MSMTNKQWKFATTILIVLLSVLAIFGGRYRVFGVLFAPLGFWLSLRREPEQRQIRPAIRVLGWLLVAFAFVALVGSLTAIIAGR